MSRPEAGSSYNVSGLTAPGGKNHNNLLPLLRHSHPFPGYFSHCLSESSLWASRSLFPWCIRQRNFSLTAHTFTNGTISVSFSLAEVIAKGASSDVYRLTLSGGEASFTLGDADITALLGK